LKKAIIECIGNGIIYYGNGGALGFDTLAALAVLELKLIICVNDIRVLF